MAKPRAPRKPTLKSTLVKELKTKHREFVKKARQVAKDLGSLGIRVVRSAAYGAKQSAKKELIKTIKHL